MTDFGHTPIKPKDYLALLHRFPEDKQVVVIHMLRFNDKASYPSSSPFASLEPVTGRQAFYSRYIPAGVDAAKQVGIKPGEYRLYSTSVTNLLAQNDTPWDLVAVRQYASFADYARYQSSAAYTEGAKPHREAALREWSLVACIEEDPPKP